MINNKRRRLLQLTGAAGVGMLGYSIYTGLRFPPLMLSIEPVDKQRKINNQHVSLIDAIFLPSIEDEIHIRAYAPEPKISIEPGKSAQLHIKANNIHPDCTLKITGATLVKETVTGITRDIIFDTKQQGEINLEWTFPDEEPFDFAAIGDTGGGPELDWCIQRAHTLGAKFLLHLGDFNYMDGEYEQAIEKFYTAPLPCYITIGNHDFHDDGSIYQKFQHEIGALNNQFVLGGVRFVNIDTAAGFFPPSSGPRGELMEKLITEKGQYHDSVVFTHKPLKDPRPNESHDVGGVGEIEWLTKSFNAAGIDKLICGHIHIQAEVEHEGILNIIAGQGLGHQDFLVKKPISKILIGSVAQGQKVSYTWQDLNMPILMHCNERNIATLEATDQIELKQQLVEACND